MAETTMSMKVLRMPALRAGTGMSQANIYRLVQKGQFPKPIKLSTQSSGWIESEVIAWLESRIAQRDGGVK